MTDYSTKKGVIVIGTPRCGSHVVTRHLFINCQVRHKRYLGEVSVDPSIDVTERVDALMNHIDHCCETEFCYLQIVQSDTKLLLALKKHLLKDYWLINLRRRNKVEQYLSWCVFVAQSKTGTAKHSPVWEEYKKFLPIVSDEHDIKKFIRQQAEDHLFGPYNEIIYYEDMLNELSEWPFKKNVYPMPLEEIVTDYPLTVEMLSGFKYE
jgi:hypothetical protein